MLYDLTLIFEGRKGLFLISLAQTKKFFFFFLHEALNCEKISMLLSFKEGVRIVFFLRAYKLKVRSHVHKIHSIVKIFTQIAPNSNYLALMDLWSNYLPSCSTFFLFYFAHNISTT